MTDHQGRILLIGNHPPPFGGVPSHIEGLAAYLSRRQWVVHVLSLVPSTLSSGRVGAYVVHRPLRLDKARSLVSNLPRHLPPGWLGYATHSPKRFAGTIALANLIADLVSRYDIQVISAYHLLPAALPAAWVSRTLQVPLVTSVFGEIYAQPKLHRKRLHELQSIVHTSRRLLSCSRHCANSFQLVGLSPRVEVIYYGVDINRFSPAVGGSPIRERFGLNGSQPVVLYVGRMQREMGLHTLLNAISITLHRMGSATFIVAGARGELTDHARHVAAQFPGRVFVEVDVAANELPSYYGAASIVVAPSSNARACLGLAIAEAMASGKVVVACNVGGTVEIVSNEVNGILVQPEDPGALASAMIDLLQDEVRCCKMGLRGREVAEQHFDQEQTNSQLERLFSELRND